MYVQCSFNNLFFHLNYALLCCQLKFLFLYFFHTFSAFWLWSSVVSVLISVTTDIPPNGGLSRHNNFSLGSCSNEFTLTTRRPSPRIAPRGVWWTRKLFYDTTTVSFFYRKIGPFSDLQELQFFSLVLQPNLCSSFPLFKSRRCRVVLTHILVILDPFGDIR
jgi:hypothetical protein